MLKTFEKEKATRGCRGTIFGTHIFTENMEGYLDELVWGYLKKGMKVYPHKHPHKEVYIFVRGKGTMQVNDKKMAVKERDIVFIPPHAFHTAWNDEDEELEFILVRAKNLKFWAKTLIKAVSIF